MIAVYIPVYVYICIYIVTRHRAVGSYTSLCSYRWWYILFNYKPIYLFSVHAWMFYFCKYVIFISPPLLVSWAQIIEIHDSLVFYPDSWTWISTISQFKTGYRVAKSFGLFSNFELITSTDKEEWIMPIMLAKCWCRNHGFSYWLAHPADLICDLQFTR